MRWLVVLFVAGCSPSVTGTWRGPVTTISACADNSGSAFDINVRWAVIESGRGLTITPEGSSCGTLTATPSGCSGWDVDSETCPVSAPVVTSKITGGEIRLTGTGQLEVALHNAVDLSNGDTCNSTASGHLLRDR